ncbi:MAG TPA: hypothetical protein VN634_19850 [Candidatus Limnocylindrales bacterium]|nr:hypothetical protein [Candidatus Limnocylindrales bacterium]
MSRIPRLLNAIVLACLLVALRTAAADAAALCGDVNSNGTVTSTDALSVLRKAVGQPLALTCPDFINRYGFPLDTNLDSAFEKNYLLGFPVTIEFDATVTHFGLIMRTGGAHVQMVLYKDAGGSPGQLVATSASTLTVIGSQEIPIAPTHVTAGVYWIMGVYDANTTVATDENTPSGTLVRYQPLVFGSPIPQPFVEQSHYGDVKINYWVKVQQ